MGRYTTSERRQRKLFTQREGEDFSAFLARQLAMARPSEVARLFLLRNDEQQRQAMTLLQQARSVRWAKLSVIVSTVSLVVSIGAAVVAIVAL